MHKCGYLIQSKLEKLNYKLHHFPEKKTIENHFKNYVSFDKE